LSNNLADSAKSPERTIRYNQSRGVSIAAQQPAKVESARGRLLF
jgi:hypothetical protein